MLKGLIRQIERQFNADVAYDTGFDSAVSNGWGYWRVLTDYEDDDTFEGGYPLERSTSPSMPDLARAASVLPSPPQYRGVPPRSASVMSMGKSTYMF